MSERVPRAFALYAVLVFGLALIAPAARAHKVNMFASAVGRTIEGEVYFSRGAKAANVRVMVRALDGRELGETKTDGAGAFTFEARLRCDHVLVADVGDGHVARFTIAADELTGNLPLPAGGDRPAAPQTDQELAGMVEKAVSRQVAPLRRDLARFRSDVRLHDVLGGIGYILGLMGLAFFFLGARRKRSGVTNQRSEGGPERP